MLLPDGLAVGFASHAARADGRPASIPTRPVRSPRLSRYPQCQNMYVSGQCRGRHKGRRPNSREAYGDTGPDRQARSTAFKAILEGLGLPMARCGPDAACFWGTARRRRWPSGFMEGYTQFFAGSQPICRAALLLVSPPGQFRFLVEIEVIASRMNKIEIFESCRKPDCMYELPLTKIRRAKMVGKISGAGVIMRRQRVRSIA